MIKYVMEFIGTFFFLSVILFKTEPIAIGVALTAAIFFGASISGAHFNPAVSFMLGLKGGIKWEQLAYYVGAQLAGAYVALKFYQYAQKD